MTNRVDCCSERLNNFEVQVSNNPDGVGGIVCGTVANMQGVAKATVDCPQGTVGQYVRISIRNGQALTLCEVEVQDGSMM